MPEIKLAGPVRKLIEEKEAEIEKLTKKVKSLESKIEGDESELDTLRTEKEEHSATLKEKEAEIDDLRSKFEKSEKRLAKAREAGEGAGAALENLVYMYILGAGGEIAIPQCARALGVKKEAVKEAIDRLVKKGRVAK